jgi:hypothetical protein
MATSSDKGHEDEKDEKDDAEGDAEASAEEKPAGAKAGGAEKKGAAAAKDEDDEEGDEDDEEEDEDDPAAKAAPAKPAAKPGAKPVQTAKRTAVPVRGKAAVLPAKRSGGSLGKSMILFVIIVGGLAAAFAFLGKEENGVPAAPKWTAGQTVDLEVTLVASDKRDLSCAAPDELSGKHCAFEGQNKPWTKSDNNDDKKLLKPYTTTDHIQFLGAGLWSDPALSGALPTARFSVKCKYKVDGKVGKSGIRWASDGPWYDAADLYTGSVSDCKMVP